MSAVAPTIELNNVGPIGHLSIPIPEQGGVVVLLGKNGSGKSHAIAGVQSLTDTGVRKSLVHRDGSREGAIEGLGVKVRLGRSNTVRGQMHVESLDSVLDPSILVDPGLKSAELCDQRRVHVLSRLAGLKVSRDEWIALIAGNEDIVQLLAEDLQGDDPVEVADRLRRNLHDKARRVEKDIEGIQARADVAGEGLDEQSTGPVVDTTPLHEDVRRAETELTLLQRSVRSRHETINKIQRLQEQIEEAAMVDLVPISNRKDEQQRSINDAQDAVDGIAIKLEALKRQLIDATHARDAALCEFDRIVLEEKTAIESNKRVEVLKAQAEQAIPDEIPESRIEEAIKAVADRRQALETEVVRNQARAKREKWQQLVAEAGTKRAIAETLRDIARSTDSVIEAAFAARGFSDISIDQGRLCVRTDRGIEPVSELSHGERWKLALDVASRGLGRGAVVAVAQEAWESLDPANRQHIAGMARDRGIVLLTAECSDGELRAEVLN
jgi:DNA-binding NarL/FixJ family response regulator